MTRSNFLNNKYYLCLKQSQEAILWNPADTKQAVVPDCVYFGKVFEAMEKILEINNLTFYITWDIYKLPSYGQNVVAIVLGDEWCRIPMYFHKVRAIFKCYGTELTLGCNLFTKPSLINFLTLTQYVRSWFYRLPSWLNYRFHKLIILQLNTAKIESVYDIPIGYYNQLDLPLKDQELRLYDIYFAGSVGQSGHSLWSLKRWLGTPKSLSRKKLIQNINIIKEKYPELKVELLIAPDSLSYARSDAAGKIYSEKMMDAKICLIPRGTSFETYRFFEALRYGCILVTEALPSLWFYDGHPASQVTDWSELEEVLEKLLENKHIMQKKSQESLNWWTNKCSEAVVGSYIAEKLNSTQSV